MSVMYYQYFFLIVNIYWSFGHGVGIDWSDITDLRDVFSDRSGEEDNTPRNSFLDVSYGAEWIQDIKERSNQIKTVDIDDPDDVDDSSEELANPVKREKRAPYDTIPRESDPGNRDPIKVAQEKCVEYAKFRYANKSFGGHSFGEKRVFKLVLDCDFKVKTLIVGGSPAEKKEFPHLALIGSQLNNEASIDWICGGSLISDQYVLSAAHCNDPTNPQILPAWVLLGDLKRPESVENIRGLLSRIVQRINHPQYKPPLQDNDIALFKLTNPVTFGLTIRPVCLALPADSPPTKNNRVVVTGWGRTAPDEQESDSLSKVIIDRLQDTLCVQTYKDDKTAFREGFDAKTMICAGRLNESKDTCQGDSGGPLQSRINKKDYKCMWLQEGITSLGSFLCGSGIPAVYTKVSSFLSWIQPIVWPAQNLSLHEPHG